MPPQPPIPDLNPTTLCGAIGDLMRASFAWGAADAKEVPTDAHIPTVAQAAVQLFTLVGRREPNDAEMKAILGG